MISVGLVADHTHEAPSDHTGVGCPVCLPTRTHAGPASAHCRPSAPREAGEASRHPWVGGRPSDRPQCPCLRAGTIIATSVQGVCGRCRPGPIARLWDPSVWLIFQASLSPFNELEFMAFHPSNRGEITLSLNVIIIINPNTTESKENDDIILPFLPCPACSSSL